MIDVTPITLLKQWLAEERQQGATNPQQAVLATATKVAEPQARVVAIREINERDLLFFTQSGTRKVKALIENPKAVLTFWFELFQREIIIEGNAFKLSNQENKQYWDSYPYEAQVRYSAYAPTSGMPIQHKKILEEKKAMIMAEHPEHPLPLQPNYCGFRIIPERIIFYAYRTDELSDVFEYRWENNQWTFQWLSP